MAKSLDSLKFMAKAIRSSDFEDNQTPRRTGQLCLDILELLGQVDPGSGGLDESAMWAALGGSMTNKVIDKSHLPTFNVSWEDLLDKPSVFPPSAHKHTTSDITDLETWITGKGYITDAPLENYVTLGTYQEITGLKQFSNGFYIGSNYVEMDSNGDFLFHGNIVATGDVAAFRKGNSGSAQGLTLEDVWDNLSISYYKNGTYGYASCFNGNINLGEIGGSGGSGVSSWNDITSLSDFPAWMRSNPVPSWLPKTDPGYLTSNSNINFSQLPNLYWADIQITSNSSKGKIPTLGAIEFLGSVGDAAHGGYIDFHYGMSSDDYTARIIDWGDGLKVTFGNIPSERKRFFIENGELRIGDYVLAATANGLQLKYRDGSKSANFLATGDVAAYRTGSGGMSTLSFAQLDRDNVFQGDVSVRGGFAVHGDTEVEYLTVNDDINFQNGYQATKTTVPGQCDRNSGRALFFTMTQIAEILGYLLYITRKL